MENITESKSLEYSVWVVLFIVMSLCILSIAIFIYKQWLHHKYKKFVVNLNYILDDEVNERKKIAAQIHDKILGDLSALKVYIALAKLKNAAVYQEDYFNEINECIENAIENTRAVHNRLLPSLPGSQGIAPALQFYCERNFAERNIELKINSYGNIALPQSSLYHILRILEEIITVLYNIEVLKKCHVTLRGFKGLTIIEFSATGTGGVIKLHKNIIPGDVIKKINVFSGKLISKKTSNNNSLLLKFKNPCLK